MSVSSAPCALCCDQGNRRISPQLIGMYSDIMQLPPEHRREQIEHLLDTYPPCAVVKMAMVYGNQQFATVFAERFSSSRHSLPSCEYRNGKGTTYAQSTKLFKVARALSSYVFTSSNNRGCTKEGHEIFGVSLPTYDSPEMLGLLGDAHRIEDPQSLSIVSARSICISEKSFEALENARASRRVA